MCVWVQPGYKTPESCTYFLTCFNALGGTVGTDRWLYILIQVQQEQPDCMHAALLLCVAHHSACHMLQGVILGIALDVGQFELFVGLTDWLTVRVCVCVWLYVGLCLHHV